MFLPQFHRDPFNDEWWGPGFTEWDLVRKSVPLFPGHRQPRLPQGGEFCLADKDELASQFQLATSSGLTGFCMYDYWYDGVRLLRRPLDLLLDSPDTPFRFCLAWANHAWTRSWTNRSGASDLLIEQTYARDGDGRRRHFTHLARAFNDPRYIRTDNRPVLLVYNSQQLAGQTGYLDDLRSYCEREAGLNPWVVAVVNKWKPSYDFVSDYDAVCLFQPSFGLFGPAEPGQKRPGIEFVVRAQSESIKRVVNRVRDRLPDKPRLFDYEEFAGKARQQLREAPLVFEKPIVPMASVGFDNSPRYQKRATILENWSSAAFAQHVKDALLPSAPVMLLNSWNEWGEGAHLQPDSVDEDLRVRTFRAVVESHLSIDRTGDDIDS